MGGFCVVVFRDVDSAQKALDSYTPLGKCRPWEEDKPVVGNNSDTPPTSNILKVGGLPTDPKSRDVFRVFYNYSVIRIRDTGDDIFLEFNTDAECQKAFREKSGQRLGSHFATLSGGTREEMDKALQKMKSMEQNRGVKGGYGP